MEYLITAQEMKRYDSNTIHQIGIPGMVLMERAALEAFRMIEEYMCSRPGAAKTVFIMAGMGNNGGDGLALARLLCEAGWQVEIQCVGKPDRATEQWRQQKRILEHFPVSFCGKNRETEYTIMVDALFGVGLSRQIEGEYVQAVESFNRSKGFKLSLDIPSGIHSDTGEVMGCAVSADMTVTFGFLKRGLIFFPGAEHAGRVVKVNIGIDQHSFLGSPPNAFCYEEMPEVLLPPRDKDGNKGTFGKVLLVAGSVNMAGAAVLAARGAYRIGAGMVKIISPLENRIIVQETLPEALYGTLETLEESLRWADVVVIGPGLGTDRDAIHCLELVMERSQLPLLIDADGLNVLAAEPEFMERLAVYGRQGRSLILTPHVGELSRLLKVSVAELKKNLMQYGLELAEKLHAVIVAKDARTFVCKEQHPVCVNIYGNSGMATAGSGDVLAGMIGGLLAQGMEPFEAASVGVYCHARAGDRAAAIYSEYGCMAGDLTRV